MIAVCVSHKLDTVKADDLIDAQLAQIWHWEDANLGLLEDHSNASLWRLAFEMIALI